jgi:transcription antitermination factor NusG
MTTNAIATTGPVGMQHIAPAVLAASPDRRWYAVYTSANHEKRVVDQLAPRAIEHFLPLYESVRRWKDRRMKLQLPLFPGYVFVRLWLGERLKVLQVPGVVRFVGFAGGPAVLPELQIEALRSSLRAQLHAEPCPYIMVGRRVRVMRGPLEGVTGILIRKKNVLRVVVSLDLLVRSAAVEVDAADIERAS